MRPQEFESIKTTLKKYEDLEKQGSLYKKALALLQQDPRAYHISIGGGEVTLTDNDLHLRSTLNATLVEKIAQNQYELEELSIIAPQDDLLLR